jgi:uncharacterized membrane protein YphA (DoxX/SURF4 family)
MLAAIFVSSGADAVMKPDAKVGRAQSVTDKVVPLFEKASPHLPTETRTLVQANGAVQVVAGLLLLTRLRKPAAAVLAATLVPTTLAGHPFWSMKDPAERAVQRTQFLKNLGLFGGLLLAAVDTEGKPGLRWRAGHLAEHSAASVRRGAHAVVREAHHTRAKVDVARTAGRMGRRLA